MKFHRLFPLIVLLFVSLYAYAQEQIKPQPRIYVSPEGKMYINKSLPLYLKISTSPDDSSPSYLLKSEHTPKYTNPMYLDAEGLNTIRTPSAVDTVTKKVVQPLEDIVFEVYADSKPPFTQIKYENRKKITREKNGKIYANGPVMVKLYAFDECSGVDHIYYSLDGAPYQIYESPIQLDKEKEYTLKYYATDRVGNMELVKSKVFVIDESAPHLSLVIEGDRFENMLSGRSRIVLASRDTVSGIAELMYKLDSGTYKSYQYPVNAAFLEQGEHTIHYYATDDLDNNTQEQTFTFYVDKTPPIIVKEFIGHSFVSNGKEYASGKTLVKLTTFDNKSGIKAVYYSVNGGPYKQYDKPFYPADINGAFNIKAYALDNVNNKSTDEGAQKTESTSSYIDISGPRLMFSFKGPVFKMDDTLFISSHTDIKLRGFDDESGMNHIEYKVDDENYQTYSSPLKIEKEGRHVVHFIGYDNVDNTNQESFLAIVDNTGPEIFSRFSIAPRGEEKIDGKMLDRYPPFAMLFLSSTDNKVGLDRLSYIVNGSREQSYQGMISSFKKTGAYNVKVKALDRLGNATEKDLDFVIANIQ